MTDAKQWPLTGRFGWERRDDRDGSVTVRHDLLATKAARRSATGRWVRIRGEGRAVYRVLRFDPSIPRDRIATDWDTWLALVDFRDDTEPSAELRIQRARWWHLGAVAVSHPDPVQRLALRIAGVAFVLGVVGLVLGLLP